MFDDADCIFRYTRRQAIADGVLVDLSHGELAELAREAGVRLPLAMTSGAFAATVGLLDDPMPAAQDIEGRLWDVLMVYRHAVRASGGNTDRVWFEVKVWDGKAHQTVKLWALCGPGDAGEPVLTIMLEGED